MTVEFFKKFNQNSGAEMQLHNYVLIRIPVPNRIFQELCSHLYRKEKMSSEFFKKFLSIIR